MKNCLQAGNRIFLDLVPPMEVFDREIRKNRIDILNCRAKIGKQFGLPNDGALREFLLSFPVKLLPAEMMIHPLPDITTEMKNNIPDGIVRFVGAPPYIAVGELVQTRFDLREVFFQKFGAAAFNKVPVGIEYVRCCNHNYSEFSNFEFCDSVTVAGISVRVQNSRTTAGLMVRLA
jgi:hypothetical protein